MHEAQPPLEVEAVFNKRGSDWTPKEKYEAVRWLNTDKLRSLRVLTLHHLGHYATREKAEDVLQEFYLEKWEGVVRNYDPARQSDSKLSGTDRFRCYLETSLKKFCWGQPGTIGYNLRLMTCAAADDLVKKGRKLVIVALVGTDLHIRIFDATGKKVVDKAENELVSGIRLTDLKKRLTRIPDESGLSKEQEQNIIEDATLIADYTRTIVTRYVQVPLPKGDEGELTVYELTIDENGPAELIEYEEERRIAGEFVTECLRKLKPEDRKLLEMGYFGDLSHEQIADELCIPVESARQKRHRALAKLGKWMTKYVPRLRPKDREVIEMQERHKSHKKIAEELGIPEKTVNARLVNAWRELLACLREEGFA